LCHERRRFRTPNNFTHPLKPSNICADTNADARANARTDRHPNCCAHARAHASANRFAIVHTKLVSNTFTVPCAYDHL